MAIVTGDLLYKYSKNTGPGNSSAQADPNDSIGGFMSSSAWAGGTLHDLFDVVTGDENAASDVEYRCIFVHNNHATLALQTPKIWIVSQSGGVGVGADIAIALDGVGITVSNSASAQAERVANENTAPSGEVFSTPTTKAGGLSPANIPAGSVLPIWVRRSALNTAAVNSDDFVIRIEGDTSA
jgi:hypothetical protein